jgi:hypothetical protein
LLKWVITLCNKGETLHCSLELVNNGAFLLSFTLKLMVLLWLIILESFASLVEDFLKDTFLGEISNVIVQPTSIPRINGNSIVFFIVIIRVAKPYLS